MFKNSRIFFLILSGLFFVITAVGQKPLSAENGSNTSDSGFDLDKFLQDGSGNISDVLPYTEEGSLQFTFTSDALNPDFVLNVPKTRRENDARVEWRPNYTFYPEGEFVGIFKPRVSGSLRTESSKGEQTRDVTVARVGVYEAYARYAPVDWGKWENGFIDLTGGYGQLFSPGNIWKTENVSGNPSLENQSTLASVLSVGTGSIFSFKLLASSNYTSNDARLASSENPDTPASDFVLNTEDLADVEEEKIENQLNDRFDYLRPGGIYYNKKRQDALYERPLYIGGQAIFAIDSLEVKLSARGANHLSPEFGAETGLTLFDSLLLYAEGSFTHGRSGLLPVAVDQKEQVIYRDRDTIYQQMVVRHLTGEDILTDDISDSLYLRFADPVYTPQDVQEGYGFMPAYTGVQYRMYYDNKSAVSQALGGIQYTLPFYPITINLEYAYDGNGYTQAEYKEYRRALHWATGPGLGQISVTTLLPRDEGKDLYTQNIYEATNLINQVGSSQSSTAAGASSEGELPVRLGQHYGLLQLMIQGNEGRDTLLIRYVANLQDSSGYVVFYGTHTLTDSWTLFGNATVFDGPFESEFHSAVNYSVTAGARYSW